MAPLQWQVQFRVRPSLRQPEIVQGYAFEVEDGETCITVTYETSAFDEVLPDRQGEYEYAEETLARQHAERIRHLMLMRMIYQRVASPIEVEIIADPTLLNRDELAAAGINLRRDIGKSSKLRWAILNVGDSLDESDRFWQTGFSGKAAGYERDALRVADWLARAEAMSDPIQRFILTWIGFNGLYGLLALIENKGSTDDAAKFMFAIESLIPESVAEKIAHNHDKALSQLESYQILSKSGKTDWGAKLCAERSKQTPNYITILKLATRCIYGIRKAVFHEAPEPSDIVERTRIAKELLTSLTLACLKSFVTY